MHLLTVGLNHQTAPVAIRERAAFAPERLLAALQDIRCQGSADEVAILSTCNRTELYCGLIWLTTGAWWNGFAITTTSRAARSSRTSTASPLTRRR